MKIQIDFDNKVVRLESNTNLGDFIEKIKQILPNYSEFKLDTNTVIEYNTPTIIYRDRWTNPYPYAPVYPFVCGTVGTGEPTYSLGSTTTGIYNLELN